ncbi:MAG TPA: hypothetical protein VK085_04170, partial [Pseudogracilibacillus sp.]|nr:hypothetical protein [Pseudogracilibacillus sp.]
PQMEYTRFPWAAGEPLRATHYGLTDALAPIGVSHIPFAIVIVIHIFYIKIRLPKIRKNKTG